MRSASLRRAIPHWMPHPWSDAGAQDATFAVSQFDAVTVTECFALSESQQLSRAHRRLSASDGSEA